MEFHGSSVAIRSKGTGAGREFIVSLPRHVELRASASPGGSALVMPLAKTLHILIVDDSKDGAFMLSMLLDSAGHETFVEHDGQGALERAHAEAPDICILDISLPDMDGNEIARRLRSTAAMTQPVLRFEETRRFAGCGTISSPRPWGVSKEPIRAGQLKPRIPLLDVWCT